MKRLIVKIDEDKCDGCGLCVPACAEGALQIIDGKARLVSETLCDGLGACLAHCPRGAITVEEREAEPFEDPHGQAVGQPEDRAGGRREEPAEHLACGCPVAVVEQEARLGNWPVQIRLVPPGALFLKNAHLVVAADCTAFACPDFHRRFVPGRALLVGCPKLDNACDYIDRLAAIMATAAPRAITVLHMEVPCCFGMNYIVQQAMARAGVNLPVEDVTITTTGEVKASSTEFTTARS